MLGTVDGGERRAADLVNTGGGSCLSPVSGASEGRAGQSARPSGVLGLQEAALFAAREHRCVDVQICLSGLHSGEQGKRQNNVEEAEEGRCCAG